MNPRARSAANGITVAQSLAAAADRLRGAGVEGGRRDARLLLAAVLGAGPERLIGRPERVLTAAESRRFEALVTRRLAREPVSRILGRREFWSLSFKVTPDTLDPRPDSETLVEAVLARIADRSAALSILDLGTGSGCLLLALLSELPAATGLGVDLSPGALAVARENAASLGLAGRARFLESDWAEGLPAAEFFRAWQVIVSNPPYIKDISIDGLEPEVARYEPGLALRGGVDGLDAYRSLAPQAAELIAPGGLLALEVGAGQAGVVESLLTKVGLKPVDRVRDLAGVERCVLATAGGKT